MKPIIITGVCVCGHSWEDHHLGMIVNAQVYKELQAASPDHPPYVPQECEYYGCNEVGGMMPDENGDWVDHCHGYHEVTT